MMEEYQTENFLRIRKENRSKFGFVKDSSAERNSRLLFKSRSSCSAEVFYVLMLNGIGLDWTGLD